MEQRYTVTRAAEILGVRASVLRYWEEELDLHINRNEQGHRYYTGYDITLLANIKELKKRGLALRAIKDVIPKIAHTVRLIMQEMQMKKEGEEECRSLDAAIRRRQLARKEAAVALEKNRRGRRRT